MAVAELKPRIAEAARSEDSSGERCIYLVNQVSGRGHLDMYARLYSKCLLDNGYRVVLISQHDPGIKQWLAEQHPGLAPRFLCFTRDGLREDGFEFLKARAAAPAQRPILLSRAYARLPGRLRAVLEAAGRPFSAVRIAAAFRALRVDGWGAVLDALGRKHELPFGVHFGHIADEIREAAWVTEKQPDFILFLYLDMMSQAPESLADLDALGIPWAGIRFHPNGSYREAFRAERFLLCDTARGAIFLNPQSIPGYKRKLPKLHIASFPDVTDAALLPTPSQFVRTAKARAAGRKIVLQLGTLSPHKGIFDLIALIRRADPDRFFFVIAGEPMYAHYGDREEELRNFLENPPGNCLTRLGYLEDERELNSIIVASDVLYAVYGDDFYNSSNTITKAAIFERPILVSDRFLMGERVRNYRLGEVVKGGDIEDTLFWLEEVAARPAQRFGFAAYRRVHSVEALNAQLPLALQKWLGETERS